MVLALRALPSSAQFLSRRNCQHAKQKAAAPAPPCARPCPPSRLPRHYYFPVGHGIRASCTAWFLLCFIFQTLSVFEKSAGSGFSRQPRRGLAQGCVKQKWRYFLRCAFLLRAQARAGLPWPARSAGGRSTGPSSDSASPLYRDGQEAQVPRAVPFGILPLRTLAHPCASQEARERPPQGDEKRVFHHSARQPPVRRVGCTKSFGADCNVGLLCSCTNITLASSPRAWAPTSRTAIAGNGDKYSPCRRTDIVADRSSSVTLVPL